MLSPPIMGLFIFYFFLPSNLLFDYTRNDLITLFFSKATNGIHSIPPLLHDYI